MTSSAYCVGTPIAYRSGTLVAHCLGTSLPFFACSSMRVLREGASVLGGGATEISSSSDHSNTVVLHVRVVWSPPSEMPPGLRGAVVAIFLFFWPGSSATALFPQIFFDTGDGLSDETLMASSSGRAGGRAFTPFGQSPLSMPKKYTALSCEWIFA